MSDNELLDSALDAAEATIQEREEESTPAAPVESAPTEEAPKAERVRDESGKFAKAAKAAPAEAAPQVSDQVANEAPEAVEPRPEEVQPEPPIEVPQFWSAELRQAVAGAKSEDAKELLKHFRAFDVQREEAYRRVATEAQRATPVVKRMNEAFEPYRLKLQANGVRDPVEASERLLAWNEMIENDFSGFAVELMRRNGVTPEDLAARFYGEQGHEAAQGHQQPYDPRLDQYAQELEALKAEREAEKRAAAEQQLNAWKAEKDSSGQPRAQFFDMYRPQIVEAFQQVQQEAPHLPEAQALTLAYDFVMGEARKAFGVGAQPAKPQPKPAQVIANMQKAQAAASSVKGAPTSGTSAPRPKAKNIDEALDRAEEALGIRD